MKKFAYASLAIAAIALTSCGGNKSNAEDSDTIVEETLQIAEDTMANDSETVAVVEEVATETVRPAKPAAKPAAKKEEPKEVANKRAATTPTAVTATAKPNPTQPAASSPRNNDSSTGIDAAANGTTQATGTAKGFSSRQRNNTNN